MRAGFSGDRNVRRKFAALSVEFATLAEDITRNGFASSHA